VKLTDDTDLGDALDAVRAEVTRLREADQAMAATSVTGRSSDRTVEVSLQGYGALAGITISPEAMDRHDHTTLAAALMDAVMDAVRQSFQQAVGHFPEIDPADADGRPAASGPAVSGPAVSGPAASGPAVSAWHHGATA
jgi:DNA-binding protein YbaB